MDWQAIRDEFPLNREYVHLAQFFMVSHPRRVAAVIDRYRDEINRDPFLVVEANMFGSPEDHMPTRIAASVAAYTGGDASQVALIPNTTTGLGLLYHGLHLRAGDEILTTTEEHFSHHEAIRLASSRIGASWRPVPIHEHPAEAEDSDIVARLEREIRPQTRVLGITWVHSGTGLRGPVRKIAEMVRRVNADREEHRRLLLIVDGTHGFGALPDSVESLGCDFFVSSGHKWMFGPRGSGIIWGAKDAWQHVSPVVATYSTWDLIDCWMKGEVPAHATRAVEFTPGGFIAYEYQWAMIEAFEWHMELGRENVAARIAELNWRTVEGLAAIPGVTLYTPRKFGMHTGIICFDVDGVPAEDVVAGLLRDKVIASTAPYRLNCARLSAGLMNSEADIDRALGLVNDIARAGI